MRRDILVRASNIVTNLMRTLQSSHFLEVALVDDVGNCVVIDVKGIHGSH